MQTNRRFSFLRTQQASRKAKKLSETTKQVKNNTITRLLKLFHYGFCIVIFAFGWFRFRYHGIISPDVGFRYNYFVIIAYAVVLLFFCRTYNAYMLGYNRIRSILFSQITSQFFTIAGIYLAITIAWNRLYEPSALISVLLVQIAFDLVWAYLSNRYYYKLNPPKKTILIYRDDRDKKRFGTLGGRPTEKLYKIKKELKYDGNFDDIREELEKYDAIFVAGVNSRCRNGILKYCKETGTPGFFLPHVGDIIMQEAKHIQTFDSPLLMVDRKNLNLEFQMIKRLFDIVSSALGLIVLSPILIITALAIKIGDGGPVLYRQVRLTKDGKEFKICKFRSMRVDAEGDGVARLSSGDSDDRITPVGRFIRKVRIDELPQLWNILTGDMSVVGPRPERPEIAEQYYKTMHDFKLRLQVKAGLTGYAQVYGKYNTDPYQKLEFDLMYINDMSILTDLRLMFATFKILFSPESTEGIDDDQTTAMD